MNKSAISTILAVAALSIAKKASGSRNDNRIYKVYSKDDIYDVYGLSESERSEFAGLDLTFFRPEGYIDWSFVKKFPNLKSITLVANYITSLPIEITEMQSLEKLSVEHNQITSMPPEIGNLTNLKVLEWKANRTTEIPLQIGNLTNLKTLDLSQNVITFIPSEIGNLNNLERLYLARCELQTLPDTIKNLSKLKELNLLANFNLTIDPRIIRQSIINGISAQPISEMLSHTKPAKTYGQVRKF